MRLQQGANAPAPPLPHPPKCTPAHTPKIQMAGTTIPILESIKTLHYQIGLTTHHHTQHNTTAPSTTPHPAQHRTQHITTAPSTTPRHPAQHHGTQHITTPSTTPRHPALYAHLPDSQGPACHRWQSAHQDGAEQPRSACANHTPR